MVASVVDISSIMIAYAIGATQSSFLLGLAYGLFDAFLVVWLRKPIFGLVRRAVTLTAKRPLPRDVYIADVA